MTHPLADPERHRTAAASVAAPLPVPQPPSPSPLRHERVSEVLRRIVDEAPQETISIGEIVEGLGERAFGLALILFSLPNCMPMPPGAAGIVGLPVLIFSIQMMLGHKKPWLPGFVKNRRVSVAGFRRVIDAAEPRLKKFEAFCRPRLTRLFSATGDRMIGLFAFLVAIAVLIPFPGTNFPPSLALVIVSIAVMEEDGIALLIGSAIGIAGFIYTAAVTGAAIELTKLFFGKLFGI